MGKDVEVALTQSQADFVGLKEAFTAFFGGVGCGKSFTMGFIATRDAYQSSNSIIAIYEPEWSLVKKVAYPSVEYFLDLYGVRYKKNVKDHVILTSTSGIGDFMFMSMDDPSKFIGYQSSSALFDELDTLKMEEADEAWSKGMARNRHVPTGVDESLKIWSEENQRMEVVNRMYAFTTPEGYKFCYHNWVKSKNPDYAYIQGKTRDNPKLTAAYLRQLTEKYPEHLRRAYLEGEFVPMTSGRVYYAYDRDVHNSNETIRPGETLHIGCDFNVGKMAATIFVTRDGGREWHAVDELHSMLDTPEMIKTIHDRWQSKGHTIYMYPDRTGSARHHSGAASASSVAQLSQAGFLIFAPMDKANPLVVDRVSAVNKGFSDRRVFINSEKCPTTADCLEQQPYKNGVPDKDGGLDHQNDATGYPLAYRLKIHKVVTPINVRFMTKGQLHYAS